jgi:hypothetical protein
VFSNPDADQLCAMLRTVRRIAVIGLSPKPERPSHRIARALQRQGFTIVPVRPALDNVLGERAYGSLREVPGTIDLVNVFRASEHAQAIVDDCAARGIGRIWFQEGIRNEDAAARACALGMTVVMDRCILRDWNALCL